MNFVAEHQLTAARNEVEALRNACNNTSAQLVHARDQISRLEQQLSAANFRADTAAKNLQEARKNVGARALTEREKLYARLGLTLCVPDAFIPHVRRAVLITLHPDKHPPAMKKAAERRFVEAMSVIEQIERDRHKT